MEKTKRTYWTWFSHESLDSISYYFPLKNHSQRCHILLVLNMLPPLQVHFSDSTKVISAIKSWLCKPLFKRFHLHLVDHYHVNFWRTCRYCRNGETFSSNLGVCLLQWFKVPILFRLDVKISFWEISYAVDPFHFAPKPAQMPLLLYGNEWKRKMEKGFGKEVEDEGIMVISSCIGFIKGILVHLCAKISHVRYLQCELSHAKSNVS